MYSSRGATLVKLALMKNQGKQHSANQTEIHDGTISSKNSEENPYFLSEEVSANNLNAKVLNTEQTDVADNNITPSHPNSSSSSQQVSMGQMVQYTEDNLPIEQSEVQVITQSEQLDGESSPLSQKQFTNLTVMSPQPGTSNVVFTSNYNPEHPTAIHITRSNQKDYRISPLHSNESDVDDSDADPNFESTSSGSSSEEEQIQNEDIPNQEPTENEMAEDERKKKGKKRKPKPETWGIKKVKLLRNSGQQYISSSKTKKVFTARQLRPPCKEKCRLDCSRKISETVRQDIFSNYWKLANLERQREFIASNIESIKPKYRYSSTQNLRNLNSAFYFEINRERVRVCKTFFKATLDINDRPIRTVLMKKNETGFLTNDLRGKHGKQPTVDPEIKDSVKKFIDAIPRIESHYLRAQTTREYIEGGKSLADLYRDYKEDRERQQLPFANAVMFNRIFNGEYNISFFVPKKDQCDVCESFQNADDAGKEKLSVSYNLHQREKELSRLEKTKDKNNASNAYQVAVYDLQAVLPIPRSQVSVFYYKSKLNCYNFTISDLHAKNVDCYFWNEIEGKRGAVEIGSCVMHYLQKVVENTRENINNQNLNVVFYSDNCSGQQKNKYLLAAYSYAVNKFEIQSITHKFLIHGHSQNEGDNIHSVIEKQVTRHLKSGPIYVPEQYISLIRAAKKNGPPYRVHECTHEDFYDWKIVQEQWGNNFTMNTDQIKVKWGDIQVLKVEKDSPNCFFYKTSYEDETFKKVDVRKTRNTRFSDSFKSTQLVRAYSKKIPLADNKKKDLQELCNKNLIPKYYILYYKNVLDLV